MTPTYPSEFVFLDDGRRIEVRWPFREEIRAVCGLDQAGKFQVLAARCSGLDPVQIAALTNADRRAIGAAIDRVNEAWLAQPRAFRRQVERAVWRVAKRA